MSAEIWIGLREYQGKQYIDVREFFLASDDNIWHPTKKGIMLLPELVPNVIQGLVDIEEEAEIGVVARVPKTKRDEIQIGIREFAGRRYAELRVWYSELGATEKKPSSRGVTFRPDLSAPIADALRQAHELLENAQRM